MFDVGGDEAFVVTRSFFFVVAILLVSNFHTTPLAADTLVEMVSKTTPREPKNLTTPLFPIVTLLGLTPLAPVIVKLAQTIVLHRMRRIPSRSNRVTKAERQPVFAGTLILEFHRTVFERENRMRGLPSLQMNAYLPLAAVGIVRTG